MGKKTPKKLIKLTQGERLKSVEESTALLMEFTKEITTSNKLMKKQIEAMLVAVIASQVRVSLSDVGGDDVQDSENIEGFVNPHGIRRATAALGEESSMSAGAPPYVPLRPHRPPTPPHEVRYSGQGTSGNSFAADHRGQDLMEERNGSTVRVFSGVPVGSNKVTGLEMLLGVKPNDRKGDMELISVTRFLVQLSSPLTFDWKGTLYFFGFCALNGGVYVCLIHKQHARDVFDFKTEREERVKAWNSGAPSEFSDCNWRVEVLPVTQLACAIDYLLEVCALYLQAIYRIQSGGYCYAYSSDDLFCSGIFEVNCSKDIKVQGIIGPCASLGKKSPLCSETEVGQGNTCAWKMCGLDKATSLCLVFDIVKKDTPDAIGQPTSNQFYLQFLTYYQHSDGEMRLRATTLSRRWVSGPGSIQASSYIIQLYFLSWESKGRENHPELVMYLKDEFMVGQDLIAGFDQEAAAVAMARLVSFKMESELPKGLAALQADFDPIRWLDRSLIRLCSRFGDYQKDTASSFSLSPRFSIFPQFMFNLRRSQFVQVFNNSPDETAYFRMILNRENVANSVAMIQPSLISYSFQSIPVPVLLDVAAIGSDRILLLDSYFTVVIFHGTTIAQWRKAGYQEQPEHEVFAQLLRAPVDESDAIMKERFPVPRLVVCDQHGSQARFLLAKLNPSSTYNSDAPPPPGGDVIFTDDVSFEVFLDHLQRLAVQ
ncbi:hypothetical protein GIB67_028120 [Kingdonia uniflora]|uniref:Protein transport protein SEC23 n=1 Tax=Kingdonia uniflora TaxID=39325 RepID=A0A7J7KZK2_9MAGN|nr:hypothetical protein GIB67_028120 [Kingdonia uniflora]